MADMKANLPKMPANMQKSMQDTIDQMQAQHEAQEKDAEFQAMMEKSVTMGYESQKQQYASQLKQFQLDDPEDPNVLVATRLKEFLAMSATVPAEAQLVPANGKMKFADKSLEGKPYSGSSAIAPGSPRWTPRAKRPRRGSKRFSRAGVSRDRRAEFMFGLNAD